MMRKNNFHKIRYRNLYHKFYINKRLRIYKKEKKTIKIRWIMRFQSSSNVWKRDFSLRDDDNEYDTRRS